MKKLLKHNVLGLPMICFLSILLALFIGILVGSFLDFNISETLYNETTLGEHFATYGSIISFSLYPAVGMCFFKAIKKKGKNYTFLAWTLLVIPFFLAVHYSDIYNGAQLRSALGNFPAVWFVSYLIWVLIYAWVPVVCYFIIDDSNPERLIAVGVTILVAGVVSDCISLWLKQLASRPRYYYLITLDNPREAFRNWWEWNPYAAGNNDAFKSWPSGNMMIAAIACMYPLFVANCKKTNKVAVYVTFILSAIYVILYGYNRIHMGKHFLSDVCFGVLFTYVLYVLVDQGFELSYRKITSKQKKA